MTPDTIPAGFIRLTEQAVLGLRGADRLRFLNGQVTNDIRLVEGDTCIPTAVLDAKGRLEAVCHVRDIDGSYLIDAPASLEDPLAARLDRYLIADDVEITKETSNWHLIHVLGTEPPPLTNSLAFPVNRFGVTGTDLWSRSPIEPDLEELDSARIEALRIGNGVPSWPAELHPGIFPAEAGLDATAVSFDKGCYLGQEVVSRMKRAGKTNQHLVHASVPGGTTPGSILMHEQQEAGTITSVSPRARSDGRHTAIAYRRRKFEDTNSLKSDTGPVEVLRRLS